MVYHDNLNEAQKWIIGLYCGLLFLLISSPFMYKLTGSLTKLIGWETSENGCPNISGLFLHTVVFILLLRVIMLIPKPNV